MKKIMSIGLVFSLVFSILISMPVLAYGSNVMEVTTGGTASKVTYTQNNNSEEICIFSSSTKIVGEHIIPPGGSIKNYRLCFEIENVYVSKTIIFDVNKGTVDQIRMANMSNPMRTSVVVETTKKPQYKFSTASNGKAIILTLGDGSSSPAPSPSTTPAPSTTPSPSSTPKPSTTPTPVTATPAPQTGNQSNSITKNGPLSWAMSGDSCVVTLNGIGLTQTSIGSNPRFELREREKLIQITLPGKDERFTDGFLSGNSIIYGILVNYNKKLDSTIIRISYANTITYSHTISGGSSIFNIKAGNTSVPVTKPTQPSESPIASPKPTSSTTPAPTPTSSAGASAPNNIKAGDGDGKTVLRLVGSGIVSKYNNYKNQIITDESKDKSSITFMIPVNIVNLGNGTLNLNDSAIKSATAFSTTKNSFLTLEKKDSTKKFEIIAGSGPDELLIVLDAGSGNVDAAKVVVLDPGHGGNDPGAVKGSYYEKNYNLDIALRCEAILKSKGINVHMTRSTDVYVSLENRVKFANDKKATLFVSIHNNSMPSGMKGSMVLYHYTSYNGKAYAKILLDNMVKDLGTGNLGLSARQNTVVLRDTKMPAILAEVACMSDESDLALLNSDSFMQKAAESLASSIIQILSTQ